MAMGALYALYTAFAAFAVLTSPTAASPVISSRDASGSLESCPGYKAKNVETSRFGMTADLTLAGKACNVYGEDLDKLTLTVEYQTPTRLHVLIEDVDQQVYQVPTSVFPRPEQTSGTSDKHAELEFNYHEDPFSFTVKRRSNNEVLFDTSAAQLVFESQYVRLRTKLPHKPSLYGMGEHTDPFMLNTSNYIRTTWNRDAFLVPSGTNLYGDHPIYFDHRNKFGTHGVFLLNSNGMDVKINDTDGQYLEYNLLGGVLDFYFLAGPDPLSVAQQYSELSGKSAMMPYWGHGFHQCRYGMQDVYEVAEVVANYSAAAIPLETMWTDIDYMDLRKVFTLDPDRFPLHLMRQLVSTLHERQQHYIMMVDPAVAYQKYPGYENGIAADAFLKFANGSIYEGVVWPGPAVFPDWFGDGTQGYWNGEFDSFFSADHGVDIDALWIDMNEASNFCEYPCWDPVAFAKQNGDPPPPAPIRLGSPRPIPGFPADFQPQCHADIDFRVNAETYFGENIYVFGSAVTIGSGNEIDNAVLLSSADYPEWSLTIDMPAHTTVTYQYVRLEEGGSWIYENITRTVDTGGCGSLVTTNDTITTPEGTPPSKMLRLREESRNVAANGLSAALQDRSSGKGSKLGLPGRNLITPAYTINNAAGSLSDLTINTDLVHQSGNVEYDTHNLFGAMMSVASRNALLSRRPTVRPMVITRSTFAGSGSHVGKWFGDNNADWAHYLISMAELLEFGALYQVPMAGSDVCGYAGVTNDKLCARWATMGAFSPFFRNHENTGEPPHEFYRWGNDSIVAVAARNAISTRYQLLDYLYTAMYVQSQTGTPVVEPMFFAYPDDQNVNPISTQYLYGPSIMVAPVTEENSTTTSVYLPNDVLYDYWTGELVNGATGRWHTLTDVAYTTIPLYYKGGSVVPQRASGAETTAQLRDINFVLVVAPDENGMATGSLYLDDGESIVQHATSFIHFKYDGARSRLDMEGTFHYDAGVVIESVRVLGRHAKTHHVHVPLSHSTMIRL